MQRRDLAAEVGSPSPKNCSPVGLIDEVEWRVATRIASCGLSPQAYAGQNVMHLVDAFFASAAEVTPDGRCFILGGGIEALLVPQLNVTIPSIAMLARIHFDLEECNRDQAFTLQATSPLGEDLGMQATIQIRPQPSLLFPQQGVTSQVAISIHGLALTAIGVFDFDLLVNGRSIGHKTLNVLVIR
jgi:hypothetical protein